MNDKFGFDKSNILINLIRNLLEKIVEVILICLKIIESLVASIRPIGYFYQKLFYDKLIDKEVELAKLKSGSKVLHIGSGPFPMTALSLAKRGCQVVAIDLDPKAIAKAKRLTVKLGLADKINFRLKKEEESFNLTGFDAVWVSLHVIPKKETIKSLVASLKAEQKLVYRNPRGLLKKLYSDLKPNEIEVDNFKIAKSSFGKEAVLLEKDNNVSLD